MCDFFLERLVSFSTKKNTSREKEREKKKGTCELRVPSNLLVRHVFVVFDVVRVGCEDEYEERDVHAEAEEGEEYAGDGLVLENGHLLLVVASVDFAVGVARRQDGVVAGAHHMATTAQTTRKSLRAEEGTEGGARRWAEA